MVSRRSVLSRRWWEVVTLSWSGGVRLAGLLFGEGAPGSGGELVCTWTRRRALANLEDKRASDLMDRSGVAVDGRGRSTALLLEVDCRARRADAKQRPTPHSQGTHSSLAAVTSSQPESGSGLRVTGRRRRRDRILSCLTCPQALTIAILMRCWLS